MLTISEQQLGRLQALLAGSGEEHQIRYLRRRFPARTATRNDEELTRFVVAVRQLAGKHDIRRERDVATALDLTVMYGPGFYDADWARDVFSMKAWSGERKMNEIRRRVRRQVPGL